MNTPKDNHSVTSSPLMCLEFIIIHTIIWGFALCILFYFLDLLLMILSNLPVINALRYLLFMPPLYYLRMLITWPGVMLTALIVTIIRCILRRTRVALSGDTISICRPGHTNLLLLTDFIRPKTVESYLHIHFIGWVFRRRYLIFQNNDGKEVCYRLYEFSEKDLNQVMQLLTRVNRTEHLDEDARTEIIMNTFQNTTELLIDPRQLFGRMVHRLLLLCILSLVLFGIGFFLFYQTLRISSQYDIGTTLPAIMGLGSSLLSLVSFLILCRALWTLTVNAMKRTSCPHKIAFAGNMLQIDHAMYSVNRIHQVIMNPPARKLSWFGHYQITLITLEGTHKYWLGDTAGLGQGNWQTLCHNMQTLLISCPAKLIYQ